jgi:hypothetical protein
MTMTQAEEEQYWRNIIQELQDWKITLEMIAEHLGVSERQVSNWKNGQRPKGLVALNLHAFHGKHRRILQGNSLHGAAEEKA